MCILYADVQVKLLRKLLVFINHYCILPVLMS